MKFTSMFFTASVAYLLQRYKKVSAEAKNKLVYLFDYAEPHPILADRQR